VCHSVVTSNLKNFVDKNIVKMLKHLNNVDTTGAFSHYHCITTTELRYAALTQTLMNIEKGCHSQKESDKELNLYSIQI